MIKDAFPIQYNPVGIENFQKARAHQSIKYKNKVEAHSKLSTLRDRGYTCRDLDYSSTYGDNDYVQLSPTSIIQTGPDNLYMRWYPTNCEMHLGFLSLHNHAVKAYDENSPPTNQQDRILLLNNCLRLNQYLDQEQAMCCWLVKQGLRINIGNIPMTRSSNPGPIRTKTTLRWSNLEYRNFIIYQLVGPKTKTQIQEPSRDSRRIELAL